MSFFNKRDLLAKADKVIQKSFGKSASTILESATASFTLEQEFDIFLSHSYSDDKIILGLKEELEDLGFSVYVDWIVDRQLNRSSVNKETARLLRTRMNKCKCLFYATSINTTNSKWMPWELGYFDGINGNVAIMPISELPQTSEQYNGQEYLGLYNYLTKDTIKNTSIMTLWVHESSKSYIKIDSWLKGVQPTDKHS
ncbi:TIR domain-containing protein [Paenibacillus sp. FSL R7-0333]|uniref:TIR domain-containing protein n=1 Tax=Paenibacillus sp. FSL R7-0333 TaxID=1926587 RepID=UPI00096F07F9|nr:hypothetical protein BK146_30345 [Paenibacillus sp. FSL R7-0333]